jgi:hypothetical protein
MGQDEEVSPHWGWHAPLPQSQAKPQSVGQDRLVSPHSESQYASPQMQDVQSLGQEAEDSPHWGWQAPLPHSQV